MSARTDDAFDVQREHLPLLRSVFGLLSPQGQVVFSTNFRKFKLDQETLAAAGVRAEELSERSVPEDFRNRRIHRCWLLQRGGDS